MTTEKQSWYNAIGNSIANEFKELPQWFQGLLILFLSGVFFWWVAKSEISMAIDKQYEFRLMTEKHKQEKFDYELKLQIKIKKVLDSLEQKRREHESAKNLTGKWRIKERLMMIKQQNPQILSISFCSLHNGGKELKPDNKWELDVIASSDKEVEIDFKDDDIYPSEHENEKKTMGWVIILVQ